VKAKKAFRVDDEGRLRFLFHAHNKSSIVPRGQWLEAKAKLVREGSRQKKYRSGFHFFPMDADITLFQTLTKNKYEVVEVEVKHFRKKPRSSVGSYLARYLYVPEEN
jgi:hypothetical protein